MAHVEEIRSLNTVRGVAAVMVAVYHAPMLFGVATILPHAYLAVDLFFVLSGFVMLHVYEPRIKAGMSFPRFLQLRAARLYPLLVIATLGGFALWTATAMAKGQRFDADTLTSLGLNLMLAPRQLAVSTAGQVYPFVVHSWSITWELVICVAMFLWLTTLRRGALVIAVLAALALGFVAHDQGRLDGGWTTETFWIGGLRALSAFSAGVVVRQVTRAWTPPRGLKLAAAVAAALILGYVVLVPRDMWWIDYLAATVGFPLLLMAAASSRGGLLETPLGDRLGEASYSVYLLHGLTIDPLAKVLRHFPPLEPAAQLALGLVWLVMLPVGAWFSWRYLETPLRRYLSRPDLMSPRRRGDRGSVAA